MHAAIYDLVNAIDGTHKPYDPRLPACVMEKGSVLFRPTIRDLAAADVGSIPTAPTKPQQNANPEFPKCILRELSPHAHHS
jgi:hypothetical protein